MLTEKRKTALKNSDGSAARLTLKPPSEKPFGLTPLRLRKDPETIFLSDYPRDLAAIPATARSAIGSCVRGQKAWPLLFWGSVGTGKTCASLALLDRAGGWFWSLNEFCDQMIEAAKGRLVHRVSGTSRTVTPDGLLMLVERAPLIVLDEIGCKNTVSDHHYDQAKRIVDRRVGKPLILISNAAPDKLAKLYDDRFASRACAGTIVEFSGKDRRMEN